MPTYSYQCKHCGYVVEAFQAMSDAPLTDCPGCHQQALDRVLFSAPSFALKGGGWYKTDYSKENKTAPSTTVSETKDVKPASSGDGT